MPSLRVWASDVVLLGAFLAASGAGSLLLGQDANWDLQNYHYYNAWAWWHGRYMTIQAITTNGCCISFCRTASW